MRRCCALGILVLAGLGCGPGTPPPPPQTPKEAGKEAAKQALDAVGGAAGLTMSGITLFLYDKGPAVEGVVRKPVLRIAAETFTSTGEKAWNFEKAHAYMLSTKTQEEWELEAAQGTLKEEESAYLSGGVTAILGTMKITLEDISFQTPADGSTKSASSDKPVKVDDPAMQLDAASVKLYPDEKRFELTDVSGMFSFEKEAPEGAKETQ